MIYGKVNLNNYFKGSVDVCTQVSLLRKDTSIGHSSFWGQQSRWGKESNGNICLFICITYVLNIRHIESYDLWHFKKMLNGIFLNLFIYFFICSEFCHTLKWKGLGFTGLPHPDPPSHLPPHPLPPGPPRAPGLSACLMHPTWAGKRGSTHDWSLGWEDLLEKGIATHCSIPAWRIPCNLMGYSPWGCKELDMTAWLILSTVFSVCIYLWV